MKLQVGQAAKATGKTRQTIQAAIKRGALSATRSTPNGSWEIDAAELFRVYPPANENRPELAMHGTPEPLPNTAQIDALTAKLKAQDELLQNLKDQNADLRAQRDAWQAEADAWRQKALPPGQEKRGFFARLFGRSGS